CWSSAAAPLRVTGTRHWTLDNWQLSWVRVMSSQEHCARTKIRMNTDPIPYPTLFRSLLVIGRSPTQSHRHQTLDLRQLAAELGARYVIEGTLRKEEDQNEHRPHPLPDALPISAGHRPQPHSESQAPDTGP